MSGGNHFALVHNYRTNRDVAFFSSNARLLQRLMHCHFNITLHGGGGGIRTHGDLRLTRFPSVPIRPLSHPSRDERTG